ncbi:PREDICTED: probable E3 ubiquitin-protein ligase RNF217 [Prunus mume]|uniref:RBR-type E3 ubiquitin transferase n=1 Tax=Prunus mume TaxID=102107 RepID=A0ABM1LVY9_PRUMU|nr:PREDICTED: probable E3 ubiquitin-protein ligase RNF217 [Prunus mume]
MDLSITEVGESFNSENTKRQQPFVCEICVEPKAAASEWFGIKNCSHAYCIDCMVRYLASKLEENITSIRCPDPDCTSGLLDPEHCRSILPQEVFERWGVALCEAVVPASHKFYCPYKDCSAMLIIDNDGKKGMIVRQSDCPHCRKLFCAQCKVPWHVGFECAKFQKLNKVERERENMLRNLAKKEQWRRCPNCRFYVERSWGCNLIQCRCKTKFCYECGELYINCNGEAMNLSKRGTL